MGAHTARVEIRPEKDWHARPSALRHFPHVLLRAIANSLPPRMATALYQLLGRARAFTPGGRRNLSLLRAHYASYLRVTGQSGNPMRLAIRHLGLRSLLAATPALILRAREAWLHQVVEVIGWEHLVDARQQQRGVLLVSVHFGSMGSASSWCSRFANRPVHILRDARIASAISGGYSDHLTSGAAVILVGPGYFSPESALRQMARALKEDAIVAYTADGVSGEHAETATVFSVPMEFRTAPVALARRLGASVLPVLSYYHNGRVHLQFCPPWMGTQGEFGKYLGSLLEDVMLRHPECIGWGKADRERFPVSDKDFTG